MSNFIKLLFLTLVMIHINSVFGQRTDSSLVIEKGDTFYLVHKNIPKYKFFGNSWYTSLAYNLTKTNEFNFDFGRTYGTFSSIPREDGIRTRTYGVGYGITSKKGVKTQLVRLFWEYNYFLQYGSMLGGGRVEFIHDLNNNSNYLRPSIGLSFIWIDIFYNYSIKLDSGENIFRHGVTFRINLFYNSKDWYQTYRSNIN